MPDMPMPLPAGATIGILGGGQLGRMLAVAASRLGYRCHVFDPSADAPAGQVSARLTTARYEDTAALRAFGESVDVITYEFENIPAAALDLLEPLRPIRPSRHALRLSQHRLREKDFLRQLGLEIAPYAPVCDETSLTRAVDRIGLPAILKTATLGYDGKGQIRLTTPEQMPSALKAMEGREAVLEGLIPFRFEISVIAARAGNGAISCYDPGENEHQNGILRTTTVPSRLSSAQSREAVLASAKILNALDYIGVMGVEFFVTETQMLVNEIAPRVHNSGHWTQQGCAVDQFEQHIRAITGWPLGDGFRYADVRMENLIGVDVERALEIASSSDASLHLYGKGEAREGRKMGHVNRVERRV